MIRTDGVDPAGPQVPPEPGAAAIEPIRTGAADRRGRLPARRPSDTRAGRVPCAALFLLAGESTADFGAAVHALLASVEWWSAGGAGAWASAQRQAGADEAVLTEVFECLNEPALARLFARPPGLAEVWRERSFEGVLDGVWVSGVFDRVVVERDAAGGAPTRVLVVDFKSDRIDDWEQIRRATERHSGQLEFYRRVAALLTGVSPGGIECQLLFTGPRRAITLPARA